jgi:hypothetical protein
MTFTSALRLACIAVPAVLLAACGSGSDPEPPPPAPTYGAGAVFSGTTGNSTAIRQSLIGGMVSQGDADAAALSSCNVGVTGCLIIVRFGPGRCGAIASGLGNSTGTRLETIWGGGEGANDYVARANAITACTQNGGVGCAVGDSSTCNAAL